LLRLLTSESVKVLGRLDDHPMATRRRQASEKRQGTKSREVSTVGAAGYGELASMRTVAMVDFGGRTWLGGAMGWYAGLFGRPESGWRDCLMFALEEG
jgi:hypothetical protein